MTMSLRTALLCTTTLLMLLPACTIKGTLKATTDPILDILSSTTGKTWFTEDGLVRDDQKVHLFAFSNFENLRQDMAAGRGEYVVSLAALIGVPEERRVEFGLWTQRRFAALFPSDRTTPQQMVAALNRELADARR
jgi:hypothetical protein